MQSAFNTPARTGKDGKDDGKSGVDSAFSQIGSSFKVRNKGLYILVLTPLDSSLIINVLLMQLF